MAAAVDGSIRVAGDVGHAKINSKHVVNVLRSRFLYLARHQQIPLATVEQQITLTLASDEHPPLPFTAHEPYSLSSVQRPNRNGRVGQSEREDAVIVGNGGERAKRALGPYVEFVGITHFSKRPYDHLSRQAKLFAHILIAQLLECK